MSRRISGEISRAMWPQVIVGCLVVTRTAATLVRLAAGQSINAAASAFVSDVRKGTIAETRQVLHSLVVAPVIGDTRTERFIIVPDGQLHRVPFDLLLEAGP